MRKTVPSTQTYTDTLKEVHALRLQINGLAQEKDEAVRATRDALDSLKDVEGRIEAYEQVLADLTNLTTNIVSEAKESVNTAYTFVREARGIAKDYILELVNLQTRVEDAKTELKNTIERTKEQHENTTRETGELMKLKDDLNIYRSRLEKIIKENNLNIKII